MTIAIPEPSLVVLIGPSGAGKSTFAAKHFRPTEVVSSDECRALVSDDENNQAATPAAFRVLHTIVRERLRAHRATVVDATNVKPSSRKPLIATARRYGVPVIGIVFDLPLELCLDRNAARPRRVRPAVVGRQIAELARDIDRLDVEGLSPVHVLRSADEVERATVEIAKGPVVRAPSS